MRETNPLRKWAKENASYGKKKKGSSIGFTKQSRQSGASADYEKGASHQDPKTISGEKVGRNATSEIKRGTSPGVATRPAIALETAWRNYWPEYVPKTDHHPPALEPAADDEQPLLRGFSSAMVAQDLAVAPEVILLLGLLA